MENIDLTKFYKGRACKKCGNHWRYKSNKACTQCTLRKAAISNRKRTKAGRADSYHRNRSQWTGDKFLMTSIQRAGNIGTAPRDKEELRELLLLMQQMKEFNGTIGKAKYTADHIVRLAPFPSEDGRTLAGRTVTDNLRVIPIKDNQEKGGRLPLYYTENQVYEPQQKHNISGLGVSYIRDKLMDVYHYRTTANISKEVEQMAEEKDIPMDASKFIERPPMPEMSVVMISSQATLHRMKTNVRQPVKQEVIRKLERARDAMAFNTSCPVNDAGEPQLNPLQVSFISWWNDFTENPEGVEEFKLPYRIVKCITMTQAADMVMLFGDSSITCFEIVSDTEYNQLPPALSHYKVKKIPI